MSQAEITGKDSNVITTTLTSSDGGDGENCQTADGGGGGGGGAGAPGGVGGNYKGSYDTDGYPGEAGISYYNDDLILDPPTQSTNNGNGSIIFTWLPE